MKKKLFLFLCFGLPLSLPAQQDTLATVTESLPSGFRELPAFGSQVRLKNFIVPASLITLGGLADGTNLFKGLNKTTRDEIIEDHPSFGTHIDNLMEYTPGAAVFALRALGVKGKNTVAHEAMLYALSLGINAALVTPLKHLTKVERPDGSNRLSFPSGHTSTAFASAEFLRREYKEVSPWYGIGGYAVATATGLLRMYNNRHWLGDVVAGAGFGIASTNLAYLCYNKLHIGQKKNHEQGTTYFFPAVSGRSFGIGLVKNL
ncbi:phosphatase PAP2 family protein [Niabella beijingensis]|uniref:phosphatase PAP2 family protein n=1 Tax=Niabella beijingensis TaxID=2872700 RepID=UPI001CC0679C|nr:phosphatase PAP2 family protein [Niabella beijingensis]MBZ4188591.1 phosphatase PAP2 family protein [Niabella beijingensis]